jgi:hypothetical protein
MREHRNLSDELCEENMTFDVQKVAGREVANGNQKVSRVKVIDDRSGRKPWRPPSGSKVRIADRPDGSETPEIRQSPSREMDMVAEAHDFR